MIPEDVAAPPVRTPIFDELLAKTDIDWPDDVRPVPIREPDIVTPRA